MDQNQIVIRRTVFHQGPKTVQNGILTFGTADNDTLNLVDCVAFNDMGSTIGNFLFRKDEADTIDGWMLLEQLQSVGQDRLSGQIEILLVD